MDTNYRFPTVALHPFDGKGREGVGCGLPVSLVSLNQSVHSDRLFLLKPTFGFSFEFFFFLITVSQLSNGIFIITSMISCRCQGNQERSLFSHALGEQFVLLACQNMKLFLSQWCKWVPYFTRSGQVLLLSLASLWHKISLSLLHQNHWGFSRWCIRWGSKSGFYLKVNSSTATNTNRILTEYSIKFIFHASCGAQIILL